MAEKRRPGSTEKRKAKKRSEAKTSEKKKEEHLRRKLKEADGEIETLKDRLLRTAAELDNFRKRTEREISQVIQNANGELIRGILPIIDDLERSLKSTQNRGGGKEFRKGVELIYQKLMAVLRDYGLESMESMGKAFDVEQHDALLQIERKGASPGMVIEEHEKGYLFRGRVLRHAKVVVSK